MSRWRGTKGAGRLRVYSAAGHCNPLMQGRFPILANDVREHAYDLKYEKRRSAYKAFRAVANRDEAARRFELSDEFAEQQWEGEGGTILGAAQ
ncbi:MAG TPA: Fe-Mn family superoxide dismutase [Burkholderiales bacterium]|nr:Fe-Mn family superoxide dismutase [Burkholderiales bacterium]